MPDVENSYPCTWVLGNFPDLSKSINNQFENVHSTSGVLLEKDPNLVHTSDGLSLAGGLITLKQFTLSKASYFTVEAYYKGDETSIEPSGSKALMKLYSGTGTFMNLK